MFDDDDDEMDFGELTHLEMVIKPKKWMKDVKMSLVASIDMLKKVVDECIVAKKYGWDLETTGLDTRVFDGRTVDKIVGHCLAPTPDIGYYVPLRHEVGTQHNLPITQANEELRRLAASKAIAVFFNVTYDGELLQFGESEPIGEWDDHKKFEEAQYMGYLQNPRRKLKNLKEVTSIFMEREMIELKDLFPPDYTGDLNFAKLDPSEQGPVWYGCSDAMCTLGLEGVLRPFIEDRSNKVKPMTGVYSIEKMCTAAVRWMQRARLPISLTKVAELINSGQRDYIDSLKLLYAEVEKVVGRDVRPQYVKTLVEEFEKNQDVRITNDFLVSIRRRTKSKDPLEPDGKTITKFEKDGKVVPLIYDVMSSDQLGTMLVELGIQGLKKTATGKISTAADALDDVFERYGDQYSYMKAVKNFREVQNAISKFLLPMEEDSDKRDNSLSIQFKQHGTDTGRFATPGRKKKGKDPNLHGGTTLNLQSLPSKDKKDKVECMLKIRECVVARFGKVIVAIDYAGVELRLVTCVSREPLWIKAFFECSDCGTKYDNTVPTEGPNKGLTPKTPAYCYQCGSDRIGDLHTISGIAFFGADAPNKPDWKAKRGVAKCVHPDTVVVTGDGPRTMGSYFEYGTPKKFHNISGKTVWDGNSQVQVVSTYIENSRKMFHVLSHRGIVTCTENHRFLTKDGRLLTVKDGLVGVELVEPEIPPNLLQEKNYKNWVRLPHRSTEDVPMTEIQTTPELAYFSGCFSGDGVKTSTSSVGICHGSTNKIDMLGTPYIEWQEIIVDACEKAGFRPVEKVKMVYLGSRSVMRFVESLGLIKGGVQGSRTLRVPEWVFQNGRESAMLFLGGLIDTDGCVLKDGSLFISTKDAVFAGQLVSIIRLVGLIPRAESSWNKVYQRDYFKVAIRATEAVAFKKYMRHPSKIARIHRRFGKSTNPAGNTVRKVIPAKAGTVVDLCVDSEEHLYWTNGCITHNSTNFCLLFGGSGNTVAQNTGLEKPEGWRIFKTFNATYKGLKRWQETQVKLARKLGFVRTPFGRRYPTPDINHEEKWIREKTERNAINSPIQGASADLTKLAMGLCYKECKKRGWLEKVHMLITIHDELVFEIDEDIFEEALDVLNHCMSSNPVIAGVKWPVCLPTDAEFGRNWTVPYDCKDWVFQREDALAKWPEWAINLFSEKSVDPVVLEKRKKEGKGIYVFGGGSSDPVQSSESKDTPKVESQPVATNLDKSEELKIPDGKILNYVIQKPLSFGMVENLSQVIYRSMNRGGTRKLRLTLPDGSVLMSEESGIVVNAQKFLTYAEEELEGC